VRGTSGYGYWSGISMLPIVFIVPAVVFLYVSVHIIMAFGLRGVLTYVSICDGLVALFLASSISGNYKPKPALHNSLILLSQQSC